MCDALFVEGGVTVRKLVWFSIGVAMFCAAGAYVPWSGYWIVAICAGASVPLCLFLHRKHPVFRVIATLSLGLVVGFLLFQSYDVRYLSVLRQMDGQTVDINVEVVDYSWSSNYGTVADGRAMFGGRSYDVRLYLKEERILVPGDEVQCEAYLRWDGKSSGVRAYAREDAVVRYVVDVPLKYLPQKICRTLILTIDRIFPEDTAFFAKALLLGDRTEVSYGISTAFKVTGISHIIAVSGLHVSILFSAVFMISGKNKWLTAILGIPILLLFAAVAGFTPSITRSCLMQILMILALVFDQGYDPPTALAFSVLVMLGVDPLVICSVSFQLSVGCMAGIFLFSGRINGWAISLPFWKDRKGRSLRTRFRGWLCGGVSMTLSSMFFTTPLVAAYFGTVSLVGTITNLLVLWVVTFIFCGIIGACLIALVWETGGAVVAWVVSIPIRYVLGICGIMAKFPLAAVYTKSVYIVFWLVFCYVLITVFLLAKRRRPLVLGCCAVVGLCVALLASWLGPLTDDVRVTMLDVGQGQCILIQSDGKNFLIDCGGDHDTGTADLAAETLLSQGISRLDGVILTHFHRDHAGAMAYLVSRVPADKVFLPDTEDPDLLREDLLKACRGAEVFVDQDLQIGWSDKKITIFAPVLGTSANESGLSVLFTGENCDILITGDMSALGEQLLLKKGIPELTVLVAGHHGSKTSTCDALLEATDPEYVFISVGEDNSYGHPAKDVLDRLKKTGCVILRTDENGTIIFRR